MATKNKTNAEMPMQTRAAAVVPASVNVEKRTVDLVFSTGAKVRRYDWTRGRFYDEELSMDAGACDLSRLNARANFLNSHDTWDLDSILGVVVPGSARIQNGEGTATIQFSERDAVTPIWNDIRAGIISNISVGYMARKYEITEAEGQEPVYRCTEWMPYEISAVAVPADAGAQTRSAPENGRRFPCEFEIRANAAQQLTLKENGKMEDENETIAPVTGADNRSQPGQGQQQPAPPAVDATAIAAAERTRGMEIRKAVKAVGLGDDFADDLITRNVSLDLSRAAIFDELAKRGETVDIRSPVSVGHEQFDRALPAIEAALLHRMNPSRFKMTDEAREFRGLTVMELGRTMLEQRGGKTRGLDKMTLATRIMGLDTGMTRAGAMSTSDFPNVLANVAHRTMRAAYEATPQTFKAFTRQSNVPDFKPVTRVQISGAVKFQDVPEGGEFKRTSLTDASETYQIGTKGLIVPFTRQALINDDLAAFNRLSEIIARSAANTESDAVWSIIINNPVMGDGVALFHATHKNLAGVAAAVDVGPLGLARAAMRQQTGLTADEPINVYAKYILCPAAIETAVEKFLATSIFPTKNADVNPFAGKLQQIVEPRLDAASATAWYLSGDPAQCDTIEYAYLDGQEGLYTESRIGWDVDGLEVKARMDFGAAPIDYRAMYKNAGL